MLQFLWLVFLALFHGAVSEMSLRPPITANEMGISESCFVEPSPSPIQPSNQFRIQTIFWKQTVAALYAQA